MGQDPDTCETAVPRLWVGYKDAQNTAHFVRLHGDTGAVLDEVLRPGWAANGVPMRRWATTACCSPSSTSR